MNNTVVQKLYGVAITVERNRRVASKLKIVGVTVNRNVKSVGSGIYKVAVTKNENGIVVTVGKNEVVITVGRNEIGNGVGGNVIVKSGMKSVAAKSVGIADE